MLITSVSLQTILGMSPLLAGLGMRSAGSVIWARRCWRFSSSDARLGERRCVSPGGVRPDRPGRQGPVGGAT